MSGWRTLHANVDSPDDLPAEDEIADFIGSRARRDPRVRLTGDSLYVCLMERDSDPIREWAERHADKLGKVAIGSGNDTGPGNDSVQFYDTDGGTLERDGRRRDCPIAKDGLRVEHTR